MMRKLTQHFHEREFVCRCGCGVVMVSPRLTMALEQLRSLVQAPIIVTSGYRCQRHNETVKGSPTSQHLRGTAADIVVRGVTPEDLAAMAEQIPGFRHGGIGIYPRRDGRSTGWVHVDVRTTGRSRWTA